jgi:hypothetical protein
VHHDQHGKGDVWALASPTVTNGREEKAVAQVSEAIAALELLGFVLGDSAVDGLGHDVGDDQRGALLVLLDLV